MHNITYVNSITLLQQIEEDIVDHYSRWQELDDTITTITKMCPDIMDKVIFQTEVNRASPV